VSKIASSDFPDQWPALLPSVLGVMPSGADPQLHGALRILQDIVEESLTDEQFFGAARDIIKACYDVALNENRKAQHRSLAVQVFRSCFDLMDIVKDDHKKEVKAFAEQVLSGWLPFLEQVIKSPLPPLDDSGSQPQSWYGPVALKVQVVKTLIKIRSVFKSLLLPRTPVFFTAVWEELLRLAPAYQALFIDSDAQSRLEDADGLPFTLDFLVLDLLDFLNQCMRAPPVQKQLDAEIAARGGAVHDTPWVLDLMKLLVAYSQITQEEEGLWDIDVSLFLAEETSVSSNYTARTACGDLLIKLAEWLDSRALEGLYAYTKALFTGQDSSWQKQEAALYLFNVVLNDFQDTDKQVPEQLLSAYLELVNYAINRPKDPMLRARGYLVAGNLSQHLKATLPLFDGVLNALTSDANEVVRVSCIKAVEGFVNGGIPLERQSAVILAIQHFLETKDLSDLDDADDLLVTILETLRAAINMDMTVAIQPDSKALDLMFLVAKHGASSFHVTLIVCETFEDIASTFEERKDPALYTALCTKVLPSITGTFDVANMTQDSPLVMVGLLLRFVMTISCADSL